MYDILFSKISAPNRNGGLFDNDQNEDNINNIYHDYIMPSQACKKPPVTTVDLYRNNGPSNGIYKSSFKSVLKSLMLTASLGGAQFCFTSILSYGRPHLESIGFSDEVSIAMLLLVPMCGLVCQPVIGSYSDRCGSRIGSRTPFLLGVCILTTISSLLFSFSPQIAASLVPGSNSEELTGLAQSIAKFIAVSAIVGSGIAQDVNSACSRSLLVDKVPFSQQSLANALAAISGALGSLASYAVCSIDLAEFMGIKGLNQLHLVSFVSSVVSLCTIVTTVAVAKEDPTPKMPKVKWYDPLKEILYTIRDLPSPIRTLCNIQFFSYLPWYPILFFSSTWVEENTFSQVISAGGDNDMEEKMSNAREATIPLVVFSFASLLSGLFVPMIVPMKPPSQKLRSGWKRIIYIPYKIIAVLSNSIPKVWACSHIFLFLALCIAPIKMGFYSCLVILALVGYCWGIIQWIPFAILSELVIKLKKEHPYMLRSTTNLTVQEVDINDVYSAKKGENDKISKTVPENKLEIMIDSGAIFGVHNVYIVIPQLISAFISLGVTHFIDQNYKSSEPVSAGWCMLASSPGTLVAAYLIMKNIPKLDAQYGICDENKENKGVMICAHGEQ